MVVQKLDRLAEYCPVTAAVAAVGDRWTLLIVRELLLGSHRFNDIHRGLPQLSRTLLAGRLRRMRATGLVDSYPPGGYELTAAGQALAPLVWQLGDWARQWLFGHPDPAQLDAGWLLWRLRQIVRHDRLPPGRTVLEFQFTDDPQGTGWLVARPGDVTACCRPPGFDVDLWVNTDRPALAQVVVGRTRLPSPQVRVHGPLAADFPNWFSAGSRPQT
ncbi:winged helix-turn-helix transcriptional regulator [Rhizomonospora bruguierae]|uniref:winged helix-turn-helix transcriptional regulator n=1 Tax=Rhizomonospora bruguierae TaxID=1581705 RepID=UPI001BCB98C3|nr:helix-turn-helix domain-containing protein [Micromonospora sp. NBRC 107566]